jgi:hypothetical protein
MATAPKLETALRASYDALREVASYQLDPALATRLQTLGEHKAFLNADEHGELMALVNFTQPRTIENLRAELALKQLEAVRPELATP